MLGFEGELYLIYKNRTMKFIAYASSLLMAALISPANSLELTAQQVANPVWGTAPVSQQPTASDPLSYHGTGASESWAAPHTFFEYPNSSALQVLTWDTYDAATFCENAKVSEEQRDPGLLRYLCQGHGPTAPVSEQPTDEDPLSYELTGASGEAH